MRRLELLVLTLLCVLLLSGCTALTVTGEPVAAVPNLRLLSMPAYIDAQTAADEENDTSHLRVDIWLDASQVMGGINPVETSLYPHSGRKYREGGFHYRYDGQVGWYENVLEDMLSAAEGSRVRVLRTGNERITDALLSGIAAQAQGEDAMRSLRRDMLTYAIDPMPSLFAELSAEDMENSFYSLGTPKLNQMQRFAADNGELLENPGHVAEMSAALDTQIAAFASEGPNPYTAVGDDDDSPLLYALDNLDLSRLSIITCDPAALRRLTGVNTDGSPVYYVEQALDNRGVFDAGLSAGLYAFTLDYMGQLTSFGAADFAEPLLWGRLNYSSSSHKAEGALPMPRTLLTLVIGTPERLSAYTDALNALLSSDSDLKGLRGPENGELTYKKDGQTITQQPFTFAWEYTQVERPGMDCYTQRTQGMTIASGGSAVEENNGLSTVVLTPEGAPPTQTITLSFPATPLPSNVTLDVQSLENTRVEVLSALTYAGSQPNTAEAVLPSGAQSIVLRDSIYLFTYRENPFETASSENPFTLVGITQEGDTLQAEIAVASERLVAGYYRLRVCADVHGEQLTWDDVPWTQSLSVSLTNDMIDTWETFTALLHQYDGGSQNIPRQFQHAWGPATDKLYHGTVIPDFPPVMLAPGLSELFSQLRSAANVTETPFMRCVFDVFVNGGL